MSTADRLLELRVRIPPGAMGVCVVCCTVKDKRQSQDNQDKRVQIKYREPKNKKSPCAGGKFCCETWSLTLSEECRLRALKNVVLRRIFGL